MPNVRCETTNCQFNIDELCTANSIDIDDCCVCETFEEVEDAG